jgi:isopenicillin N synthase-like dioxygenase
MSTPPGALTCNIGDMLARWTNDHWTSTLHRVVPPAASGTRRVRRRSLARFLDGPPDLVLDGMPSCYSDISRARYQPVVAGDGLRARLVGGPTRARVELPAGAS